ncbi:hypothetical protein A2U01_0076376 [Trifolium medium]|uniref:Uncharacterized protein n=1 Tax=Trifolium medium TaxID=97028 RepID=A0A392T4M9_9FABA|nr:hypothetical protein [Trifolium medium]
MKAQEEQRVAAASAATVNAGSPEFTFSELGLDDPAAFNNFMNQHPPADG